MKRLLLASDSFKGTLSSYDIVEIAKDLIDKEFKDSWSLNYQYVADGGEGTIDAIKELLGGTTYDIKTVDSENETITSPLLLIDKNTALIEVAKIIGLPMIKNKIDPLKRTTKGIGVLIKEAIKLNVKKIYIGLGGTSTNDLGIGMLQELGINFNLNEEINMSNASNVKKINLDNFILKNKNIEFICLTDVTNQLLGKNGATYIFGPQKGYKNNLEYLENTATHLCKLFEETSKKDIKNVPGLGAAGGLAAAFYTFMDAKIISGINEILKISNFKKKALDADIVITGEGSFDSQSLNGKVLSGIINNVDKSKLIIICGRNKIENSNIPIYETLKSNQDFEYIKEHAKESYKEILRKVLQEYK